jgi:hypothetical protein
MYVYIDTRRFSTRYNTKMGENVSSKFKEEENSREKNFVFFF